MHIGSVISISKGYEAMGNQALKLGADTMAFFTRNPRGGKAKNINQEDIQKFLKLAKENGFGTLVAHASYTMNLCAARPEIQKFAQEMLADDLKRMEYIPGNYYNFHPGSHVGQGAEQAICLIANALNKCISKEQTTTILLETMAGKGSEIGGSFEELKQIIDLVKPELLDKIGVCFDTCHVWDAGYDIAGDLEGVLNTFDKLIGLDKLKAIHLNDSMNDKGSHKDRHEKIGKGKIGIKTFEKIVNHPVLRELPFILETPNDDKGWKQEIKMLRKLQK